MGIIVPLVIFATLGTMTVYLTVNVVPTADRAKVINLLFLAFGLRMLAATMFALMPETRVFHEDADGYEWVGLQIADYWHGEGPPIDMRINREQNYGYFYLCGAIYYVFGRFRPVVSYFNAVMGTMVVLVVYRSASMVFNKIVAYRAGLLVGCIPSMVLWSSMALKDTPTTLLILLSLLGCMGIRKNFSIINLALLMLPILGIQPIRFYMVYFLLFAIACSLLLDRSLVSVSGIWKPVLVLGVFIGLLSFVGLSGSLRQGTELLDLQQVSTFRHGMATTAASGFSSDVD
ncbi:MAG: glycosyltransferase family 39 protein, partial [Gaiellales bacterium]